MVPESSGKVETSESWPDIASNGTQRRQQRWRRLIKQNNRTNSRPRESIRDSISAPAHGEDGPVRAESGSRQKPERRDRKVWRFRAIRCSAVSIENRMSAEHSIFGFNCISTSSLLRIQHKMNKKNLSIFQQSKCFLNYYGPSRRDFSNESIVAAAFPGFELTER